ncbi:uncharacterized protein LOC117804706 isoform X2 [Xyrichtys novacula]|uniref:Uncharacterized protein LOC117804706 isoform X2 n=1 Tax=Xyrichtys novacula TaxID=13765 RepID=A0AAV1FGU8_XYRNO|nr:uncharacterized protein LOC117804706 isoform X2 [Xyrichtys novacula]
MWRKELTLVLLTIAAVVILGEEPVILGKRTDVSHPSGSSLTLSCNLNTKTYQRFRWFLFRNSSVPSVQNLEEIYKDMCFRTKKDSPMVCNKTQLPKDNGILTEEDVLQYTLLNATEADSGLYYCKVTAEIPEFETKCSDGTEIIIVTATPTPGILLLHWWVWMLIGVSAVIVIVLIIVCILVRRRCRKRKGTIISFFLILLIYQQGSKHYK